MEKILHNKIRCRKCGEVIESKSVHDFKYCKCGAVFVDGGREYLRRGGALGDIEELSETTPYTDPRRRYSGPGRTGICVCGHSYQDHHLGVVLNSEFGAATGECYVPQECEAFGSNEMGGLDSLGQEHCQRYRDSGLTENE